MEDRKLNERESLELITRMIQNARTNLRARMNENSLLIVGYVSVIVTLGVWVLQIYEYIWASLCWLIIPLVCYPVSRYLSVKDPLSVRSYIDRTIGYVSILYMVLCTVLPFSTFWVTSPILFFEGILVSLWIITVGFLIRFRAVVWGGIAGLIVAHSLLFFSGHLYQTPLFALVLIVTILIPAHCFKRAVSKSSFCHV